MYKRDPISGEIITVAGDEYYDNSLPYGGVSEIFIGELAIPFDIFTTFFTHNILHFLFGTGVYKFCRRNFEGRCYLRYFLFKSSPLIIVLNLFIIIMLYFGFINRFRMGILRILPIHIALNHQALCTLTAHLLRLYKT